jgi:quercetin dioxygenase-like cupin family protein
MADQLPEFLMRLRSQGVTSLGEWLNLHPSVSARFGMVPISVLHSPEIVTQQVKFAPGAYSGWHSHPGFLVSTVVSGQLVRYRTDCTSETLGAGQSFYETGANTFIVKNETSSDAVDTVTFVVPGGTPTTGLRIDKPQPPTCTK